MNVQSRSEKCVLGEMQLYSPARTWIRYMGWLLILCKKASKQTCFKKNNMQQQDVALDQRRAWGPAWSCVRCMVLQTPGGLWSFAKAASKPVPKKHTKTKPQHATASNHRRSWASSSCNSHWASSTRQLGIVVEGDYTPSGRIIFFGRFFELLVCSSDACASLHGYGDWFFFMLFSFFE